MVRNISDDKISFGSALNLWKNTLAIYPMGVYNKKEKGGDPDE